MGQSPQWGHRESLEILNYWRFSRDLFEERIHSILLVSTLNLNLDLNFQILILL